MKKRVLVTALISYSVTIFLFTISVKAEEIISTSVEAEARDTLADEAYRLYKKGNFEQALEFAQAAYGIDQGDVLSLANLAALYVLLNDMKQAAPLLEKLQSRKNEVCSKLAEAERKYAHYKSRWESPRELHLSPEEIQARAELQELGRQCTELLSLLDNAQAATMQKRSSGQVAR